MDGHLCPDCGSGQYDGFARCHADPVDSCQGMFLPRARVRYDEWNGSMDGRPVLFTKHLLCGRGFHIDLHKMVAPDDAECFHTHPAYAIRFILWGGYAEELHEGEKRRLWRMWRPGMIGLVKPSCCHRIAGFRNGRVSYSLWIRFPKIAKVIARGTGWAKQEQTHRAPDTIVEDAHSSCHQAPKP